GHPDLKGIIGQCSTSAPGAAKAVTDLGVIGKVFATGITVPSLMKPYVENGAVKSFDQIGIETTRDYGLEDAWAFLSGQGVDVDTLANPLLFWSTDNSYVNPFLVRKEHRAPE